MRELIVLTRDGDTLKFQFNEANSELTIDGDDGGLCVLEHEETAKLQNWFLSL